MNVISSSFLNFVTAIQYIAGTDEYDRRPDRKLRCPGWCDRILWKTNNSLLFKDKMANPRRADSAVGYIKPLTYERCENTISDHKPINAMFKIKTVKIDEDVKIRMLTNEVSLWRQQLSLGVHSVDIHPKFISLKIMSQVDCQKSMVRDRDLMQKFFFYNNQLLWIIYIEGKCDDLQLVA